MTERATPHLIRKYANRKLYDTTTSRYLTLNGVWELVCTGQDVKVVDHETGTDITAAVLSQIVASHEKSTATLSAIEVTPEAAQAAEERRTSLLDYLRRTLGDGAAASIDDLGRRGSEFAAAARVTLNRSADDLGRRGSELAAEMGRRSSGLEDTVEAAVARAMRTLNANRGDLSQLRRRVDELERRVASVQAALQAELERSATASTAPGDTPGK